MHFLFKRFRNLANFLKIPLRTFLPAERRQVLRTRAHAGVVVLRRSLREIVWPEALFDKFGRIVAALSAISLIRLAFSVGLAAAFSTALEYYAILVNALLGWAQLYCQQLASVVGRYLSLNLEVRPYWKHIFILLGAYFFRSASTNYAYGYKGAAMLCLVWGAVVALAASVVASTIPFRVEDLHGNFILAIIVVAGIFLFDLGKQLFNATFIRERAAKIYGVPVWPWWEFFRPNALLCSAQAIGSIAFVWAVLRLQFVRSAQIPGIAALVCLIIGLVIYRLMIAAAEAGGLKRDDETWVHAFSRTNSAGIAVSILGLIFWTVVFLLASAGLKFYSL